MKVWFSPIIAAVLFLSSCSGPEIQIVEADHRTVSSTETVRMNNCGGTDSSEQTAQQTFSTGLDLNPQSQTDYAAIENMVAGKYGLYKDTSRSQLLKAPAGTNMEFVLNWSEDVHTGDVIKDEEIGTYFVHIPVAVELVSSRDLGCPETTLSDDHIRELLIVSFKDGASGVSTENHYEGEVTILAQGVGRASGAQKSDAFYVFTDFNGEPIEPMRYSEFYNFTLWINGEPADTLVDPIPPYNAGHVYQFTINAPGGRLVFAVGDVYVADNDGYYTIAILK